jgi:hypothetical protein
MKRKGSKIYILTSECIVLGSWSNLKNLIDVLSVEKKAALYHKVYRHIQKYTEGGAIPIFPFEDSTAKKYEIVFELLQ